MKEQFDTAMEEMDKYERSIKSQKYGRFERKILVTAGVALLLAGIGSFGLLHTTGLEISVIVAVIAMVIYWIKG